MIRLLGLIPAAWRLSLAVTAVLALSGALWGAYAYVRHQGYEDGHRTARLECEAEKARQREANETAIREAEKRLFEAADQLSITIMELDDALAEIEKAAVTGPDAGDLCLGLDRVRRLQAID